MAAEAGSIRVLHVDDEPDVAELAAEYLRREDARFSVAVASSVSEGIERISDGAFDCIVSDYDMPETDGIEFLAAVREGYPELPFILYTGKGSEEVASEAISTGATDYLQKGGGAEQYELLANRIENAVQQYRVHRDRDRVYRALETATQGIGILDTEGRYTYLNEAYAALYGREREEILGEHWALLYSEAEERRFREEILPTMDEAGSWTGQSEGLKADGSTFLEQLSLTKLPNGGHICVVQDVSDRYGRIRDLERYRTILEAIGDPVYVLDAEGCYTFVNDAFVEQTGYSRAEILGEHVSKVVPAEYIERGNEVIRNLLRAEDRRTATWELERVTADGERVPAENHVALLPLDDGEFQGTAGVLRDLPSGSRRDRAPD